MVARGNPVIADAVPVDPLPDRALWVVICGLVYGLVTIATVLLTSDGRSISSVWPADAVVLALLLTRDLRDWPALLLAGWLGNLLGNGVARGWNPGLVLYGLINMGQTLIAAWLIRYPSSRRAGRAAVVADRDVLADGRTMVWFLAVAGLIAPALGALAGSFVSFATFGVSPVASAIRWYFSNALGFVILTPFLKALFDSRIARALETLTAADWRRGALLFALHAGVTLLVFGQSRYPLLFLPFPTLLLLAFAFGRLATQAGVMLVAVIGALSTIHHVGPVNLIEAGHVTEAVVLQIYLAVLMLTAMPVATIVASRAEARELLAGREELLRLIMAHSPDAILGFDTAGVCRWADGPVAEWTGVPPDDLVGLTLGEVAARTGLDLAPLKALAHADPRGWPTIELHPDGRRLTLEASLRMTSHEAGHALGSVITLRDISLRKARELAISRRIETDDLTGVYNRAGFRQRLARAIEVTGDARALTLALIDVDHFKAINDTHGHPVGDAALVETARRLAAGTRADDVVARLSGDEFAILLRCHLEEGRAICERIARTVAAEPMEIGGNVVVLTSISCGLAQLRPGMSREALFDAADLALYQAKRAGRNVVRAVA